MDSIVGRLKPAPPFPTKLATYWARTGACSALTLLVAIKKPWSLITHRNWDRDLLPSAQAIADRIHTSPTLVTPLDSGVLLPEGHGGLLSPFN